MWKRDESVKPATPPAPAPAAPTVPAAAAPPAGDRRNLQMQGENVNIGKSVVIKGELSGSEDLTIEGVIEGTIELRQNVLTIGPSGKIKAQIIAKAVIVLGEVHGNITATDKVEIRDTGSVDGDVTAPRIAISDGAHFRGAIDMQRSGTEAKPEGRSAPDKAPPLTGPASPTAGVPVR